MIPATARRVLAWLAIAVLCAGGLVGRGVSAAAATEFSMLARADVAGVEVRYRGAPLVPEGEVAYLTPGTAQAELSVASSRGFASTPYPGPFVLSLPGLISGGSGGMVDVPNYPLLVESDTAFEPEPEPVTAGPYQLSARSSAEQSTADARLASDGAAVGSLTGAASTTVKRSGDMLTTEATSRVDGLALADGVLVAGTKSLARLTAVPGRPARAETSFVPGTVTIAGRTFGLTEKGLVAGDATTPLNLKAAEDLLAQAGISFRYLPAQRTATAVTGSALDVTFPVAVPGQPPAILRVLLGGVRVSLLSAAGGTEARAGVGGRSPQEAASTPGGGPSGSVAAVPAPAAPLAAEATAPEPVPADAPALPAPPTPAEASPQNGLLTRSALPDPSADGLYLLVAGAALLALAGSRLMGLIAVRQRLPLHVS